MHMASIRSVAELTIEGSISDRILQCQTRNVSGLSILLVFALKTIFYSSAFHTYAPGWASPMCASTRYANCRAISTESTGLL